MKDRAILHADLNNFYASVESLINPELRGRPLAVSGDPEKRHGIILAKNDAAKACRVKTGEAIWEAKQKCKDLVLVAPHFLDYSRISREVKKLYAEYTPYVESFGLDECWLDVSDCGRLHGSPEEIAYKIKEDVKSKIGLTVSIGVSFSKTFAKLGSDLKKPDAVSIIDRSNYKDIAWPLAVSDLLNVGRSTKAALSELGVFTIGDLATTAKESLYARLGKSGEKLWEYANGVDGDRVAEYNSHHIPESVGNGTTTSRDVCNEKDALAVISSLSEVIAFRMRKYGLSATGVTLSIRDSELKGFSRQIKLDSPTSTATDIAAGAKKLLRKYYDFSQNKPVRTITVTAINLLSSGENVSMEDYEAKNKEKNVEDKVDGLRKKYGYGVLTRGINLDTVFTCDAKEIEKDYIPFDKRSVEDI